MKKNYIKNRNIFFALLLCVAVLGYMKGQITQTYSFTGAVQSFTVPSCVATLTLDVKGAQGGPNAAATVTGGAGGSAYGILNVTAGDVLNIYVGGMNGFNGGGNAGTSACTGAVAGNGGGASDIRLNGVTLTDRVIVGAGGGGAGGDRISNCGRGTGGGGGGGYYGGGGGAGYPSSSTTFPMGGTQTAGGTPGTSAFSATQNGLPGVLGAGGDGGFETSTAQTGGNNALPGGDGGGLTGDPGQVTLPTIYTGHSGAGGSSYIGSLTNGVTVKGVRLGDGLVTISYTTNGAGVIASSSNSLGICPGGTITLSAGNVPTYTWVSGPQNTSISVSPSVTTNYTVLGTNTINCISSAVITVSVNAPPTVTVAASQASVCSGSTLQLMAGGAATYLWNGALPGASITINPTSSSVYTVTGTSGAGCSTDATVAVVVNNINLSLTPDTSVCQGNAITLTATGATSYLWNTGFLFSALTVTPTTTTTYSVLATDVNNCQHSGSVTVTVNPKPNVTALANKSEICRGEAVTLNGTGGDTYSWNTSPPLIGAEVTLTLTVDIIYSYTVTGINNGTGCSNTATVSVKVNRCTGMDKLSEKDGSVYLFPNPNNGLFTLNLTHANNTTIINIYTISGKLIKSQKADTASTKIDMENEANGIYFIDVLQNNKSIKRIRILKE